MDSAVGAAAVGGFFGIGGTMLGTYSESKKLKQERFTEREHSFEVAQVGYRACYRKFLDNIAAYQGSGPPGPDSGEGAIDAGMLLSNFREAAFTGDPEIVEELEKYWPAEKRAKHEPPTQVPPKSLESAMFRHCARSLKQQLKLKQDA
jgi:hypothetical protein